MMKITGVNIAPTAPSAMATSGAFNSRNSNARNVPKTEVAIMHCNTSSRINMDTAEIISPIISEGDILGMVIMLAKDTSPRLTPVDEKIISVAADFLGRHLAS